MTLLAQTAAVLVVCCLAAAITVPAGPTLLRRQVVQQPMRPMRLHRAGPGPLIRVRNGPVKRIYVPMKMVPQPQRFNHPPAGYKVGPPPQQLWKPKEGQVFRQPQPLRQHIPYSLGAPNMGPPRKARQPKPKYFSKPVYSKYSKKQVVPFDSYKPQQSFVPSLITDSYGAPKPASYRPSSSTTYGKPHPYGSPEPPKKSSVLLKEEPATSYVNVYQGDKAKEDGTPTYGFSQSHSQIYEKSYEKKHKGTVYSDNEALVTNHRPVYKPKSDPINSSQATTDGGEADSSSSSNQGSFQPPKQTYGFQPYEEGRRENAGQAEGYGPSQPAQQYYKKQPDTVLGPNYYEESKSS